MNKALLQKAYDLLMRRDHSVQELTRKLQKMKTPYSEIEEVTKYLSEKLYLDDKKFTDMYVENKLRSRPCGHLKLKSELHKKGVDKHYIDDVLNKPQNCEYKAALDFLERKRSNLNNLGKEERKKKLFALLRNRGFRLETIYKTVEAW